MLLYAGLSNNADAIAQSEALRCDRGRDEESYPLFVALFLYGHLTQADATFAIVAVIAKLSRIIHAVGMFRIANVSQRHPLRFVGVLGRHLCLFALMWFACFGDQGTVL